jgi:hypothetical protein
MLHEAIAPFNEDQIFHRVNPTALWDTQETLLCGNTEPNKYHTRIKCRNINSKTDFSTVPALK